ncbi:MAG TPA: helix-turn-helix domain-containing protein [Solirubrobacter sp.]|nr:helix-turn-helix domain-containing protein [Solirubrobacter sp.]
MEGLRERKKRQTREAIAAAAMELFYARGFEAVTVADVARAADVSEKTVFNHFATKEDLVFSRGHEKLAERAEAIRLRPPGVPLTRVFEAETMAWLDRLADGPLDDVVALPRLVRESPTLHHRLVHAWEIEAAALTAAVTDEEDDLVAATVVRALVWAHRLVFRTALRRVLSGEDPVEVADDLRGQARQAYARLDAGLARYEG